MEVEATTPLVNVLLISKLNVTGNEFLIRKSEYLHGVQNSSLHFVQFPRM